MELPVIARSLIGKEEILPEIPVICSYYQETTQNSPRQILEGEDNLL